MLHISASGMPQSKRTHLLREVFEPLGVRYEAKPVAGVPIHIDLTLRGLPGLQLFTGKMEGVSYRRIRHSICYQPAAGGTIQVVGPRSNASVGGLRTSFNTSVTSQMTPGSYKIGYCIYNYGSTVIDRVDVVTGWAMVTH